MQTCLLQKWRKQTPQVQGFSLRTFHHLPPNTNQYREQTASRPFPSLFAQKNHLGIFHNFLPPLGHARGPWKITVLEVRQQEVLEAPDISRQLWLKWRSPDGLSQYKPDTGKSGNLNSYSILCSTLCQAFRSSVQDLLTQHVGVWTGSIILASST